MVRDLGDDAGHRDSLHMHVEHRQEDRHPQPWGDAEPEFAGRRCGLDQRDEPVRGRHDESRSGGRDPHRCPEEGRRSRGREQADAGEVVRQPAQADLAQDAASDQGAERGGTDNRNATSMHRRDDAANEGDDVRRASTGVVGPLLIRHGERLSFLQVEVPR